MALPPRLERGTYGLEGRCSIQLSYGSGPSALCPGGETRATDAAFALDRRLRDAGPRQRHDSRAVAATRHSTAAVELSTAWPPLHSSHSWDVSYVRRCALASAWAASIVPSAR